MQNSIKKKLIICVLAICLFASCSTSINQEDKSVGYKSLDTTIAFSGYWISENYFNSLAKYKSPMQAQNGSEFIFIPERTLIPTMMVSNFHEGGNELTVLKNSDNYQIWEIQNNSIVELVYEIEVISNEKIKIGDNSFVKIKPVSFEGSQLILEEILFKGQYTTDENKIVEFKNDGTISGLGNYRYFMPLIDYFGAGLQIDQIGLGTTKRNYEYFGFKFNSNTLEIYKINCLTYDETNKECVEVAYGELIYKLLKKK